MLDLGIDLEPHLPDAVMPAWQFMQDYPILLVVVMFILGYLVGKGLQWLIRSSLSHAAARTRSKLDDKLIQYLTAPVVQTTVILALVAAEKAFGFSAAVVRCAYRNWDNPNGWGKFIGFRVMASPCTSGL